MSLVAVVSNILKLTDNKFSSKERQTVKNQAQKQGKAHLLTPFEFLF
jgi:hypothetical protein